LVRYLDIADSGRGTMTLWTAPRVSYRLQFNRNFTFADATKIIPYLHQLGISHVYASPFFKARAGSAHGYDIVDHNAFNPEIGDEASFATYVKTLQEYDMEQILDIVPNHMGVGGNDNSWWLDVLENGEASRYAPYFDIDWHPANSTLQNKVLLPFLSDHYGAALEQGELSLALDPEQGAFRVHYFEHLFPLDPRSYPKILSFRIDLLEQTLEHKPLVFKKFTSLLGDCQSLPRRHDLSPARRRQRQHGSAACKYRLARLYHDHLEIKAFVDDKITYFNGLAGRPTSFEPLHRLLEAQAYRLAYWQVAADEINYRRFFDINELAGIRMEKPEVFHATHHLIQLMIAKGQVNGLRIDHPDGLSDPVQYFQTLQQMTAQASPDNGNQKSHASYVLVEKILANHEHLPPDWPVAGTTGYDTASLLNGLFIYPAAERAFSQVYNRFTAQPQNFDEQLYQSKKLIMSSTLASELSVLTNLASKIARTDRFTRDFTYQGLRIALAEIVACFPVYRTYITLQGISDQDLRYLHWAISQAKKRSHAIDIQIFDFLHSLLSLSNIKTFSSRVRQQVVQLALRFQQYTSPVMAKGMEDTALYTYNRLVSLNDVGFDPRVFGVSCNAFHLENQRRLADWPQSMVSTSTHDSKRGEDVRARINVLSELPQKWRQHLIRWSRMNRSKKCLSDKAHIPSRNDEYLLYQTLVGTWPLETLSIAGLKAFKVRIEDYMLKAIREAKVHTSWINPNEEYEAAMQYFIQSLLDNTKHNSFLDDFIAFQAIIVRYGLFNSLSQTLLKLTIPGVPDIYQGNEIWSFNLVDPDNRKTVNYAKRQTALEILTKSSQGDKQLPRLLQELLEQIEDGHAKLYLTWKTLSLRRGHPEVFREGNYCAMASEGLRAEHICAFSRSLNGKEIIVVSSRWFARLMGESANLPVGSSIWNDTWIHDKQKNKEIQCRKYLNVLSHEIVQPSQTENGQRFAAADLFRHFPVALLIRT
jgi:(1->4)-alpha-D-glucan 1-alpha-D-glucosylmutase